jgi:HEAT repeat protein/protein-S-isoprenylcysteine O-methyltransferase Ste14
MKTGTKQFALLAFLAIVFTVGLTFASVELPRLVDSFLGRQFEFPNVATVTKDHPDYSPDDPGILRTELYLKTYRLRWIGYGALAAVAVLIIVGFATNRSGFSSAGAIVLFLPVFGHFALTMFFLGGLGFLRLLWMPFLDLSFDVMRLGEIIVLPYRLLASPYSLTGLNKWIPLSYLITGAGLLLFFLGTLAWFHARIQKKGLADSGAYRICRHPQYLGWIVWSYGVLFLPQSGEIKKLFAISNSLPWLLATMVIVGVALVEEVKMRKLFGESYDAYRKRTSFILPLPRAISDVFFFPVRILFKKRFPERKREALALVALYTSLLMAASALYAGLIPISKAEDGDTRKNIAALVQTVEADGNAGERRAAIGKLSEIGEPAVEALIPFLANPEAMIRWNTASALGNTGSERAVPPLVAALDDDNGTVRAYAAFALGTIGDRRAVKPLVEAFWDRTRGLAAPAASALGEIGDRSIIPDLERSIDDMQAFPYLQVGQALRKLGSDRAEECFRIGLESSRYTDRSTSVTELGKIASDSSLALVIGALEDEHRNVRRAAALALMDIASDRSVAPLTRSLKDEDFEVRMYAREALRRIRKKD